MGCARVNTDGARPKESAELNYHSLDEHKEFRGSVVGGGHGLSEEDESGIKDMNDPHELVVHGEAGRKRWPQPPLLRPLPPPLLLPQQQQNPPGHIVRWERFLPLRSLKVLLIESDDSTCQVVCALLRNCSYEVTTASNGLEAWKILEDLTNRIDLVLTEVFMPYLSGVGLLCKIMNHRTCKNIPVIMMSSHDSMGIVFSCLSKGAVDFLVKPIRKNELKNLWQHVWRRCHSSSGSGSGSESAIQTQKSAEKLKSGDKSDTNTGSNDEDDNDSIGLNARDGSDNNSWTKKAVEVDSPQPLSPWDQIADPPDSSCAQVIHPKPEIFCNERVPMKKECQEQKNQFLDNVEMGKDLEIGVPRNPDIQLESYPKEGGSTSITVTKQDNFPQQDSKKNMEPNEGLLNLKSSNYFSEWRNQAADAINSAWMEIGVTETPNNAPTIAETKEKATFVTKELLSLELSLKRPRSVGDDSTTHDDRNILRHSDVSAFSRYNTAGTATQTLTGFVGSNSLPLESSSEALKMESIFNLPSNSNSTPLNQASNGSSNNNDMGSSTNNAFTKPATPKDKAASTLATKRVHPTSAFQPVQQCRGGPPQQIMPEKVVDMAVETMGQPKGSQCQVQVQHHYHQLHIHNIEQLQLHQEQQKQQMPLDHDLSMRNMAAPHCRSSNGFWGTIEGDGGNYSLNGSVSGSNNGSNGQNGSSSALNIGGMDMETDNRVTGNNGIAAGGESGSGSGVEQRVAQRVAALTKFRQKRKERCFEKKVRYHSRKRLAEQRPRVRGQFVRQIAYEHTSHYTDAS